MRLKPFYGLKFELFYYDSNIFFRITYPGLYLKSKNAIFLVFRDQGRSTNRNLTIFFSNFIYIFEKGVLIPSH